MGSWRLLLLTVAAVALAALSLVARPVRAAEEGAISYEYALDEQTELTLEQSPADPKSWTIDLRRFGTAEEGQTLTATFLAGEVTAGVLESSKDEVGRLRSVRVTGQPGEGPLEVTSKDLTLDSGQPVKIAGTFQPITSAARVERAKARWQKADAVLNAVYARVRAEVGKAGAAKLREIQRERIAMRDERSEMAARGPDDPETKAAFWDTMLGYTVDNIALLKIYSGRDVPKGLTGSYRDMFGGELDLRETRQGLRFAMSVVRGHADHVGEIAGVAELKGNRATYLEKLSKEDAEAEEKPARLTFTMSAGHIVHVEEGNTARFGGVGVYFRGDYYKAGPLKAPIELNEQ